MVQLEYLCLILASFLAVARARPEFGFGQGPEEPRRYIVTFNESYSDDDCNILALELLDDLGVNITTQYNFFKGVAVSLLIEEKEILEKDPCIESVMKEPKMELDYIRSQVRRVQEDLSIDTASRAVPWNLARVDQPDLPVGKNYKFWKNRKAGEDVNVCVSCHMNG